MQGGTLLSPKDPELHPTEVTSVISEKRYQLAEKIGQGSFSNVYRVNCQDKQYALKLYRSQQGQQQMRQYQSTFPIEREIDIHRELHHPNIVKFVDHGVYIPAEEQTDKEEGSKKTRCRFLVSELVDHDLSGLLSTGFRFEQGEVKTIVRQLLQALAYLHKRNIIHRDIKLDNILYSNSGKVCIADFGVATRYVEGEELETRLQNLNYRAPELIVGIPTYDHKIDIYNVGVVMWRLLTGKPMFDFGKRKPNVAEIFALHGSKDWEKWKELKKSAMYGQIIRKNCPRKVREVLKQQAPELTKSAIDLLDRMLQVQPVDRPDANEALEHRYFSEQPAPIPEDEMPAFTDNHYSWKPQTAPSKEQGTRQANQEKRKQEYRADANMQDAQEDAELPRKILCLSRPIQNPEPDVKLVASKQEIEPAQNQEPKQQSESVKELPITQSSEKPSSVPVESQQQSEEQAQSNPPSTPKSVSEHKVNADITTVN